MNDKAFPRRFTEALRPGSYLRLIAEGGVEAGDEVRADRLNRTNRRRPWMPALAPPLAGLRLVRTRREAVAYRGKPHDGVSFSESVCVRMATATVPGTQTNRRGDDGPVRGLLGGKDRTGRFGFLSSPSPRRL